MDDSIPTEEVSLDNSIGNNIPVHISSRRSPGSSPDISSEEETNKQMVVDPNNCQLYTEIVNVSEEDYCNNSRGILRNSYNKNNVVLRELPISTGKSDSEFTEEDTSLHSSREEEQYQNNADICPHNIFFNQDSLIEKGIIKIITRSDTGPGEDSSSCYEVSCSSSHGLGVSSSIDSSCCHNNSDKENLSPFPDNINSQTCASATILSTPATYKPNVSTDSKICQVGVEMLNSNLQSPIKKEVLSQSSSIYGESLDTSNSVFSKMSTSISSFNTNNTSGEIENNNNTSSLMIPNSFDATRIFSDHNSTATNLNSSSRESNGFVSESPMRNFESEELEEAESGTSQTQKNDFSICGVSSCDKNNSNDDLAVHFNNTKDIGPSGYIKNSNNIISRNIPTENSLNSKKCVEDNTFSSSPTSSSCESSPFTSILANDSTYQDEITPSQMNASRLLGYCQEYDKETPRSILSRMQGVDLFIKQQPFLKTHDIRSSHMTSTPLYQQQKLQESQLLEMSSNQHVCSQKTSQHSNQIIHTPHPKHGQLIYCHSIIDNSAEFQAKTPMNGPLLNSSGEENSSPPEYLPCMNSPFSTADSEERISLACLKSDMCHEDDPIRHQHNLNERKRRARITIACDLMRRLVPGLSDKTDQATVFEYAARYIHFLQTQVGNKYNRNFLVKYSPYKLMEIEKFLP